MTKKVMFAGLAGGLTIMVWVILVNGIFGFRNRIDMNQIPNEREVYEVLKKNIAEPGRYICNPGIISENAFPLNEPVYSILYGGVGHEAAGGNSIVQLILAFIISTTGAFLLTLTSQKIISSYIRRVLFFMVIGFLIAIFSDLNEYGIGSYPFGDALILAVHDIIMWTVTGSVIALLIKPSPVVYRDTSSNN
jgi:hypothetical protein